MHLLPKRMCFLLLSVNCTVSSVLAAQTWPGFVTSGYNNEQIREIRFAKEARAIVVAPPPEEFKREWPTLLVIYATPNGNTAEQTLGCQLAEGMDWHFDIQHAAAQWRVYRDLEKERNVVLACAQAINLSWPTWKEQRPHGWQYIRTIVVSLAASLPGENVRVVLTGHSGGGSFIFGYIDGVEKIPPLIERIAFLDANYGYDTAQHHGDKFLEWLDTDKSRHLVVLAYDDRNIELNGKKVVGPTGGTYRATHRMLDFLKEKGALEETKVGEFTQYSANERRLISLVHPNPENIILHTRLVGEMNGLLEALTIGTPHHNKWGRFAPPRAYTDRIEPVHYEPASWRAPAPALPERSPKASSGSEIVQSLLQADPMLREDAIAEEILRGNVPTFWRDFVTVSAELKSDDGQTHHVTYRVSPDYLMVGSDEDYVRVPLTPHTAQIIADMLGCVLPTRKMVDDIYRAAEVKLLPRPLTQERESLATFARHNRLIQEHWGKSKPGQLVAGIKKDVVVTNELLKRPGHVAIYGWHKLDSQPIQPLTTVHVDWYVDYSHGIRLVDQWCEVDGKAMRVKDVLRDKNLCALLSDEGVIETLNYRRPSKK
jgi:hypothetical protein